MNPVAVLLYPGCIFFEIALAAETLAKRREILYYTPQGEAHHASNGARLLAHGTYDELADATPAAVLVPGGDARAIVPSGMANRALQACAKRGAILAGICAGSLVLAGAGLLKGRRGTHNYTLEHCDPAKVAATAPYWEGMVFERADLVVDGPIITAQHWAYVRFAAAVAQALGDMDHDKALAFVAKNRGSSE